MDEVKIDIIESELGETILAGFSRSLVLSPAPLGGNPDLMTSKSGVLDRLTCLLFVLIG